MKKLKLDLNLLRVQTFDIGAGLALGDLRGGFDSEGSPKDTLCNQSATYGDCRDGTVRAHARSDTYVECEESGPYASYPTDHQCRMTDRQERTATCCRAGHTYWNDGC